MHTYLVLSYRPIGPTWVVNKTDTLIGVYGMYVCRYMRHSTLMSLHSNLRPQILTTGDGKYRMIERFRNATITHTITASKQPHVTSSLSVFVNAKPVENCFGKRVILFQFLGELLQFKLN